MLLLYATLSAMYIIYIIMLCALYAVACYFYCLKLDYCMLSKESEVDFFVHFLTGDSLSSLCVPLSTFLGVTP